MRNALCRLLFNFPLKCHNVNIVFTCHYLKCISSMRTYINLWLVRLIVHHPAGCGRLLALCVCLSVCICVLAIMTPRSNAKSQPQRIVWLNGPNTCNTYHNDFKTIQKWHMSEMIGQLNLEPLNIRRTNRRLIIFHKAIIRHLAPYPIMQEMVAGKRSRGKPRQRWEKYITYTFGTMPAASRVAEDRHQFRRDIWAATS